MKNTVIILLFVMFKQACFHYLKTSLNYSQLAVNLGFL